MLVVVDHLLVGEGSLTLRVPVDHTQSAVDKTFLIEVAEDLDDGFRTSLVHSESGAVPVARTTEFAELLEDDASVLVGPVPGMFEELLAGQVGFIDALLLEAFDDFGLRCDRSMVGAGHPASVLAFEACTTYKDILDGLVQHVSHVQHACYVRRRDHDRERITAVGFGMKQLVVLPVLIPAGFDFFWIVLGFHKLYMSL